MFDLYRMFQHYNLQVKRHVNLQDAKIDKENAHSLQILSRCLELFEKTRLLDASRFFKLKTFTDQCDFSVFRFPCVLQNGYYNMVMFSKS